MAVARPMDRVEWEAQAAVELPRTKYTSGCPKQPWMLGDVRKPLKVSRPSPVLKVARADRPVYDRCAVAMLAGSIWSWSIDEKSGAWLVRVGEVDDWRELSRDQVAELLDELGVPATVAAAPAVARAPRVAAPAAVIVEPVAAEVRPIRSAPSSTAGTSWNEPVAAYLARLIHPPKRAYAAAMVAHLVSGAAMPADPGTDWAEKVRVKLARLVPAGAELLAVAS